VQGYPCSNITAQFFLIYSAIQGFFDAKYEFLFYCFYPPIWTENKKAGGYIKLCTCEFPRNDFWKIKRAPIKGGIK
jgi:hypothetical protein